MFRSERVVGSQHNSLPVDVTVIEGLADAQVGGGVEEGNSVCFR